MTEHAGPQLVPTPHRSAGAILFFGFVSLLWTVWLGGMVSVVSDHQLYLWLGAAALSCSGLRSSRSSGTRHAPRSMSPSSGGS